MTLGDTDFEGERHVVAVQADWWTVSTLVTARRDMRGEVVSRRTLDEDEPARFRR